MSGDARDRSGRGVIAPSAQVRDGREISGEALIGHEAIHLCRDDVVVSLDPALKVRVRIYDGGDAVLADIATTPARALHIAGLFARAALLADPTIKVPEIAEPSR